MRLIPDIQLKELKIIHDILNRHCLTNTSVWVIGSRAKRTARKYSDLDLVIDLNHQPIPRSVFIKLLDDFEESDLPYKVDIIDWNTISEDFRELVERDRILLP